MPDERSDWRRRSFLLTLTGASAGLAGCPSGSEDESPTTEQPSTTDSVSTVPPRTTAPTTRRPEPTSTPTVVTFDGGGAAAFADALDKVRSIPGGELRLEPGTYRFDESQAPSYGYPRDDDRVHFDATGLDDVTIAGPSPDEDGVAEIVLEDPTRGFLSIANPAGATAADRPRGPTIRDLTVRHDPLPYTQGEITDLSDDRRTITLSLEDTFPTVDEPLFSDPEPLVVFASVFTAHGQRIRRVTDEARSNFKRFASIEALGGRQARLVLAEGIEPGGLQAGRRLAVVPRHRNATLFLHRDLTDPTYERVRIHSASNFVFDFRACHRPVLRDCRVTPFPDGPGLLASNADGVHCNNCPRGPLVEGCIFERTSDDAVVIDAELLSVESFEDDRSIRVAADVGTRVGAGDRLVAASPTLERKGTLPPVEAVDQRGGGVTEAAVNPELIRFTESIRDTLTVGDALVGPRMRNRETVVRDTTVRDIRARYVRFGGVEGGTIEDNHFVGTNADGIEIEAAGDIREGFSDLKGWSTDVTIRNNKIVDTGLVGVPSGAPRAIFVGVDGGEGPAPSASVTGRPHRNITVVDNTIHGVGGHGIEVADIEGVSIEDNRIEAVGQLPGPDIGLYGLGIRHAEDVSVSGTTVVSEPDGLLGFGWTHESSPVAVSDNSFVVGTDQRAVTLFDLDEV